MVRIRKIKQKLINCRKIQFHFHNWKCWCFVLLNNFNNTPTHSFAVDIPDVNNNKLRYQLTSFYIYTYLILLYENQKCIEIPVKLWTVICICIYERLWTNESDTTLDNVKTFTLPPTLRSNDDDDNNQTFATMWIHIISINRHPECIRYQSYQLHNNWWKKGKQTHLWTMNPFCHLFPFILRSYFISWSFLRANGQQLLLNAYCILDIGYRSLISRTFPIWILKFFDYLIIWF